MGWLAEEKFQLKTEEIANSVLHTDSEEVAIILSGYVAKKIIKYTKCDEGKAGFLAQKCDLENNTWPYFQEVS